MEADLFDFVNLEKLMYGNLYHPMVQDWFY